HGYCLPPFLYRNAPVFAFKVPHQPYSNKVVQGRHSNQIGPQFFGQKFYLLLGRTGGLSWFSRH
ncbi:hypothetical protein BGW38_007738, partial [Lunasporangiospora selenospora]